MLFGQLKETLSTAFGIVRTAKQQAVATDVVQYLAFGFAGFAAVTFVLQMTLNIRAPYGKFTGEGSKIPFVGKLWTYPIPARFAWFIQESPAFFIPFYVLCRNWSLDYSTFPELNRVVLSYLTVHYFNRTLIYPFRIVGGKPSGFSTVAMAVLFCVANGILQSLCLAQLSCYNLPLESSLKSPRFALGSLLWLTGFLINKNSDDILRNLRKPGEKGYKIPRGGLFEYVTAPHYFGETLEWTGFAVAGNHVGGFAFAFFSFCYLFSRAYQSHQWYHQKFDDYPKHRKIFFPFLL